MELQLCRELIVLSDRLSFSDAAERLYMTQSTLSKHVAAAEREVAFKIFERSTSSVGLTAAGLVLIEGLRGTVASYDAAVLAGRQAAGRGAPTVRVMGPLLNEDYLGLVTEARLLMAQRGIDAHVTTSDTGVRDCGEALCDGQADVAIAFRYGRHERKLRLEHLRYAPFGVFCRASSDLATKERLTFEDIAGRSIVSYPLEGRTGYHSHMRRVCRKYGIDYSPSHVQEGSWCFPEEPDQVVFGVHFKGYGRFGGDMVARPLDDDREQFDVCAARRAREDDPSVLAFYECLVQAARRLPPGGPTGGTA